MLANTSEMRIYGHLLLLDDALFFYQLLLDDALVFLPTA